MSRDSSGESLEAILASIRRSLSEQTTSVLEEGPAAPVELLPAADTPIPGDDAPAADSDAPPIPESLAQQLAAVTPNAPPPAPHLTAAAVEAPADAPAPSEAAPASVTPARTPILSLVPSPGPGAAASGTPTAPEPVLAPALADAPSGADAGAPAIAPTAVVSADVETIPAEPPVPAPAVEPAARQADPLWFLGQPPASPVVAPKSAHPVEPRPSRLGAVRGPLPPFFGSSVEEVVKVEMVPDRPLPAHTDAALLAAPVDPPLPPSAHPREGLHAAGADAPRPPDGAGSDRVSSIFDSPATDGRTGGDGEAQSPQIQALEAMVADLLRPMLRRWLDENMPRLVSAALKAEAELMTRRDPGRDPKKP